MDIVDYSKEELLERLEEIEILNRQLLLESEQTHRLEYAWTGNLGRWHWNIKTNNVTFNPLKITALGYEEDEIPKRVTYQFFTDKLHSDDYETTMNAMRNCLSRKTSVYESEYRIQTKDGKYKWYHDIGRITQHDKNGNPLLVSGIVFDITDKKETILNLEYQNDFLTKMSTTDELTNISNRRALIAYLRAAILTVRRTNTPFSIAIFDIDDFKLVNDSKGHIFGDKVLLDIATIIKNNIREPALAGRYGGEEFMVILPSTSLETATKISKRIKQAVEAYTFGDGIKITISGGVKQYEGEDLVELIDLADKKLYEAKKRGKNQIVF